MKPLDCGFFRRWDNGRYVVRLSSGLMGVCSGRLIYGAGEAYADAVVDDFGNLVVVGGWC